MVASSSTIGILFQSCHCNNQKSCIIFNIEEDKLMMKINNITRSHQFTNISDNETIDFVNLSIFGGNYLPAVSK